jgi:hypothetical protein
MKEIWPSEVNCSLLAFRSQLQSLELWSQEFGFDLFKEIGESELVYGISTKF